jgi:hypothetical protein
MPLLTHPGGQVRQSRTTVAYLQQALMTRAKTLQAREALQLIVGDPHAVYGCVRTELGIEVQVLRVVGPLRVVNARLGEFRLFPCCMVEKRQHTSGLFDATTRNCLPKMRHAMGSAK